MKYNSKLEEALDIVNWSIFSDKVSDEKPSNMTVEEAEMIIESENLKKRK